MKDLKLVGFVQNMSVNMRLRVEQFVVSASRGHDAWNRHGDLVAMEAQVANPPSY